MTRDQANSMVSHPLFVTIVTALITGIVSALIAGISIASDLKALTTEVKIVTKNHADRLDRLETRVWGAGHSGGSPY